MLTAGLFRTRTPRQVCFTLSPRYWRFINTPVSLCIYDQRPITPVHGSLCKRTRNLQDRFVSLVQDRPEALREMAEQVGHRHLTAGEESGDDCKYTQGDHQTEHEFQPAGDADQSKKRCRRAVGTTKGADSFPKP